ncbi:MAG TPA: hypothetical protein VG916_10685, partial [Gemmatimonadaceae bacterium]|nr:hypothetical protein [Gemmatimonadaceae bacterium]
MPPRRAPRLNNEAGGAGGELVRQRDAPRVSRTVQLLILVLLAAPTLVSTAQRVATNVGVDFYNVWGVSAALHAAGPALGDPWRNGDGYLAKVRELVAASGDPKLQQVATYWRVPDYTGSPLLYTIFGPMAGPYSGTLSTYQAVQVIAFVAACVLLAQLYGVDFFSASFIALISLIGYQPFVSDLRVANLGSVQFAVLAVMLACARALRTRHADTGGARAVALCAVVLAALVGLTLAKPNITLVTACIAVHLALRHGRRTFVPAALVAVGVGAALAILPCLYFGSWGVWHDWYSFVYGSNALMLVRNVDDGNYSTVAIAASALGAG